MPPQLGCFQSHLSPWLLSNSFYLSLSVDLQTFWLPPTERTFYIMIHCTHKHDIFIWLWTMIAFALCRVFWSFITFLKVLILGPLVTSLLKNTVLDNSFCPDHSGHSLTFLFSYLFTSLSFCWHLGPALQREPLNCHFSVCCHYTSFCASTIHSSTLFPSPHGRGFPFPQALDTALWSLVPHTRLDQDD